MRRIGLEDVHLVNTPPMDDLIALDEAIDKLASVDPMKADLVKLRYFAGMSEQEAAEALGISRATAARYWTYARTWLFDRIHDEDQV